MTMTCLLPILTDCSRVKDGKYIHPMSQLEIFTKCCQRGQMLMRMLCYKQIVFSCISIIFFFSTFWLSQFNTRSGNILSFLLSLFHEGQLSVTGESMCTNYWLTA